MCTNILFTLFLKQKKKKNGHFLPVGNKVYLLFLLLEGN